MQRTNSINAKGVSASLMIAALVMSQRCHAQPPSDMPYISTPDGVKRGFMLGNEDPSVSIKEIYNKLGGRIVRLPIFLSFQPNFDVWLNKIKAVLNFCDSECSQMTVVIDLHHPGQFPRIPDLANPGQDKDGACTETQNDCLKIDNNEEFISRWEQIAKLAKDYPAQRVWYDMLNEPQGSYNGVPWPELALKTAQAIRRVDPSHPIVYAVQGGNTTQITRAVPSFKPLAGIKNQIIEVHFWDWKGIKGNPDLKIKEKKDVQSYFNDDIGLYFRQPKPEDYKKYPQLREYSQLEDKMKRLRVFRDKYIKDKTYRIIGLYIGEVGIKRSNPSAAVFFRDFTRLSDEAGISTTVHAYREDAGWNYEPPSRAWPVLTQWLGKGKTQPPYEGSLPDPPDPGDGSPDPAPDPSIPVLDPGPAPDPVPPPVTPPPVTDEGPRVVALDPTTLTSAPEQAIFFETTVSDPNGAADIAQVDISVNDPNVANRQSSFRYEALENFLYGFINGVAVGGFVPGSANRLNADGGTIACEETTVTRQGNDLKIRWRMNTGTGITGSRQVSLNVRDRANHESGWVNVGTWQIGN